MTFGELAMTFDMLAKHKPDRFVMDWAGHEHWGIDLTDFELSPSQIRMLAEMGWCLGNNTECDEIREEEIEMWENPQEYTDEEIVELFNKYKSIYKYNNIDYLI